MTFTMIMITIDSFSESVRFPLLELPCAALFYLAVLTDCHVLSPA